MARQVVFYGAISIDGYLADENYQLNWLTDLPANEVFEKSYQQFVKTVDTTVMGRQTFEDVQKMAPDEVIYPEFTNYVMTSQKQGNVENITFIHADVCEFIQTLKQQTGKAIWIVGGGRLLAPLIAAGLIDDWYIQTAPIFLGKGISLFQNQQPLKLNLLASHQYGQFVENHYETIR